MTEIMSMGVTNMKRLLIIPPTEWTQKETESLRIALNGTPVEISIGDIPNLLEGMDYMLVVTGDEINPHLRFMGQAARDQKVEIVYTSLPESSVVEKIKNLAVS